MVVPFRYPSIERPLIMHRRDNCVDNPSSGFTCSCSLKCLRLKSKRAGPPQVGPNFFELLNCP